MVKHKTGNTIEVTDSSQARLLTLFIVDSHAEETIDRISSYEPRRVLERLSRKKHPGTTEWLIAMPEYIDWEADSAKFSILWFSGKGRSDVLEPHDLD